MDWFRTTVFADGIFRLDEPGLGGLHSANSWMVVGNHSCLLIDAGTGVAPLAPVVGRISKNPVICLLTHTHYDHIGGAHEFADRRVHPAEAHILCEPTATATLWQGWLQSDSFSHKPNKDFDFSAYAIKPAPATRLVDDTTSIHLGGRNVTVLHAPGHSPGLVCVFETETQTLFTSDALYDGHKFFDLPGSDRSAAQSTLDRLAGLDVKQCHPGHFGSFDRDRFFELVHETSRHLQEE